MDWNLGLIDKLPNRLGVGPNLINQSILKLCPDFIFCHDYPQTGNPWYQVEYISSSLIASDKTQGQVKADTQFRKPSGD